MKLYLDKIKSNKPINFFAFKKMCIKSKIPERIFNNVFYKKHHQKELYYFDIIDEGLYADWFSNYEIDIVDKVTSAMYGNSKKKKSEYTYILIKDDYNLHNPFTITIHKGNYELPENFNKKRKLLIIENVHNFFDFFSFIKILDFNVEEYNIALGNGLNFANSMNMSFINSFDVVYCLFDLDLGGFKIFSSLRRNVKKDTEIIFYLNNKMKEFVLKYGKNIDSNSRSKMNSMYSDVSELKDAVSFVCKNNKFAEQEIFQGEI